MSEIDDQQTPPEERGDDRRLDPEGPSLATGKLQSEGPSSPSSAKVAPNAGDDPIAGPPGGGFEPQGASGPGSEDGESFAVEKSPEKDPETGDGEVLDLLIADGDGDRLDKVLMRYLPDFSRTAVQRVIRNGGVTVEGKTVKASSQMRGGDRISLRLSAAARDDEPRPEPEKIPLDIVYEDEAFVIVNKQAGLAIHPSIGRTRGTMVNALVHHFDQLSQIAGESRPGVVHRLDKDTTGVIVVAKTDRDHARIAKQFELRKVEKEYVALVYGVVPFDSDYVNHPIARHRFHRERMAVDPVHGKPSTTFYAVVERFDKHSIVRAHPKSGRTHQIRVHMASIGHPILADASYARRKVVCRSEIYRDHPEEDRVLISRQALHAHRLSFDHPRTGERVSFMADLPSDMLRVIEELRRYGRANG